ncbi:hypothetical protein [Ilumatobacter sp.]|uniref:hypothetical protein n=1 Tax=Ilumatobacter sp. TaxID=1967498 RepID=UPI003B516DC2
MSAAPSTRQALSRFADGLLAGDLPGLDDARRAATVDFVLRRVEALPSVTRAGVVAIGAAVDVTGRALGHERTRGLVLRSRLPLLSEYPRLVRSLAYAHVWETWPDTEVDGSSAALEPGPGTATTGSAAHGGAP